MYRNAFFRYFSQFSRKMGQFFSLFAKNWKREKCAALIRLVISLCFFSGYRRWEIPATCIFNSLAFKSGIVGGPISCLISSSQCILHIHWPKGSSLILSGCDQFDWMLQVKISKCSHIHQGKPSSHLLEWFFFTSSWFGMHARITFQTWKVEIFH